MADEWELQIEAPGVVGVEVDEDESPVAGGDVSAPGAGDGPPPPSGPITEAEVRDLLDGLGAAASMAVGDEDVPGQWQFEDDELDALAPPLTRIINRRPKMQAAVRRGDGFLVVLGLVRYGSRNIDDGREARKARGELDREVDGTARRHRPAPAWLHRRGDADRVEAGGDRAGGDPPGAAAPRGGMG